MGNTAGVAGAEVKLGVGLIGILLAILAAVISVRSSRRPVSDETVDSSSHLVDSGEVVPAEFHARADMPTVLKPRASLPPPVYGVESSLAEVRGSAVPHNGSAEALAMAGDAPAPRDFMPKLPARPPTGNVPPRYSPVATPAGDHLRPSRIDLEPTFDRPIATLPPATEDVSTERHAAPAGQKPVDAAEQAYPATTLPETAIGSENPQAAGSSQPDAAEQIPVWAAPPTGGTPGSIGQVNQPNGGRRYLVEEGDSLSEIARYELGDVNLWTEIHQLNRGLLGDAPDSIRPGMWLVLPIGAQ